MCVNEKETGVTEAEKVDELKYLVSNINATDRQE